MRDQASASCRSKARGKSLFFVIVMMGILISGVFVLMISLQGNTFVSKRVDAQTRADEMAHIPVNLAYGFFKDKKTAFDQEIYWGWESDVHIGMNDGPAKPADVEEGRFATLTFVKGDEPYSTNNLNGTSVVLGWNNVVVPPGAAHLVGVGHHFGVKEVTELLVTQAGFPFSVAAAGTLQAKDLEVYAVPTADSFKDGPVPDDEKLPGHLLSNSNIDTAVQLGANTTVTGDVSASGLIVESAGATIIGEKIEGADPQTIPAIRATDFDPTGKEHTDENWTNVNGVVSGRNRYSGDLTVGDLEFYDGLLYVDGNLTVTGTCAGRGAIVATGDVRVTTGRMDISNSITAIVSGRDVVIEGQSPKASLFKGIVFAEGSIEFRKTTVIGASISADPNGSVVMDEVTAANAPETNAVFIQKDVTLDKAIEDASSVFEGSGTSSALPVGVLVGGRDFIELKYGNEPALKALAPTLDPQGYGTAWKVVTQTGEAPPNDYAPAEGFEFNGANTNWEKYVREHATSNVQRVDVFDLDLNRALSITDQLEVKYRRSEPYRR